MASRFGSSSSGSTSLKVTNTPSQELALTNLAFCSPSDLPKFAVPGHTDFYLAQVADSFIFSISYP
ncbi:Aspartate decarboxylase-like domain superfamily [Sesbania bispinosa]|nr:Aspartate decarboxylase-like domain superfamily [Sesbania bispinosa]